jgi:hypothetical protein
MYFSPIEADPGQSPAPTLWRRVARRKAVWFTLPAAALLLFGVYGPAARTKRAPTRRRLPP